MSNKAFRISIIILGIFLIPAFDSFLDPTPTRLRQLFTYILILNCKCKLNKALTHNNSQLA